MKTKFAKKEDIDQKWYIVDAKDQILGRLATRIALYLRGKHKPFFTPNVDTGDFIIVINADKVKVTGKKLDNKIYYYHTGYVGNLKSISLRHRMQKEPEKVITDAVWGMLPKNRLGRAMLKKLRVYKGSEHPHSAQKPEILQLTK
ncbi:MAG: 50S ribosomal protein L13 [Thermodesulfovibrionales bacterium]|nr:50S ribosomal protein L13 [Thermodesulfovibrionales bacterium]